MPIIEIIQHAVWHAKACIDGTCDVVTQPVALLPVDHIFASLPAVLLAQESIEKEIKGCLVTAPICHCAQWN